MTDPSGFFQYPSELGAPLPQAPAGFLADRTITEWTTFLGYTQTRRFVPGELVLEAGRVDRALYLLVDGRLEGPGGVVEPVSAVGEGAFLDGGPRAVNIRAITSGELERLGWEALEAMFARDPLLARAVLADVGRILAARLRGADPAATGWTG